MKNQKINEYENKTGILLPTDSQLEETINKIFKEDKGVWVKVLPEDIVSLLKKSPDEIVSIDDLQTFSRSIVSFCYEQTNSFSASMIAKLFGLCILKSILIWNKNNFTLENDRILYKIFQEPLERINKAYFGDQDIVWHSTEISVFCINATIRIFLEYEQNFDELIEMKYYNVIRGSRGVSTPARKEYQRVFKKILE